MRSPVGQTGCSAVQQRAYAFRTLCISWQWTPDRSPAGDLGEYHESRSCQNPYHTSHWHQDDRICSPRSRAWLRGDPRRPLSPGPYVAHGGEEALIVGYDLLFISRDEADRDKGALGRKMGLAPKKILLNTSHTHSGPRVGRWTYADYETPDRLYLGRAGAGTPRRGEPSAPGGMPGDCVGGCRPVGTACEQTQARC